MPFYNRLVQSSVFLIAWYLMAVHGYATLPDNAIRMVLLLIASAVLIYRGITLKQKGRGFSALFTIFFAICCYLFYAEALWLLPDDDKVWATAVVIYNLLRYTLIIIVFFILLLDFMRTLKGD